jgi:hypothetical protein
MKFAKLCELSLADIRPEGWLRHYLQVQRDGLTGHLEVAGYPFNGDGWASTGVAGIQGDVWWPYEQTGYWIDGMMRCGHLLGDRFLIDKARRHVEFVLAHPDPDGYLGPKFMRVPKSNTRWPHAVFFRAMEAEHSASGDKRIPKALARHYLTGTCDHTIARDVCNVESMLWAYDRTGDKRLLQAAIDAYEGYNRAQPETPTAMKQMLSETVAHEHGVTYNEIGKLGAVLYLYTGNRRYLAATVNAYRKIDRDHMLADGVCSSSEYLCGKDALASHETCDIADYTWAVGYLLMATGDARYADKIEKAVFNAAPGVVKSDDFKALQYFSCPNQVVADRSSNHNLFFRGSNWMSYRPNPPVQCCPGEVNRIMPNFAARMWMTTPKGNGIVAAFYGPSVLTTTVAGQAVTIVEETQYPFSEHIDFTVRTDKAVKFALHLRIPGWCRGARLRVNGQPVKKILKGGTFVKVERLFEHNDRVSLELPMELKVASWPKGGISIERGPLVYALKIDEDWQEDRKLKCTPEFPAWSLYPRSAWNYALCVDAKTVRDAIEVIHHPVASHPWSSALAPIELRVPARKVAGWKLSRSRRVWRQDNVTFPTGMKEFWYKGDFCLTPPLPDPATLPKRLAARQEMVTLVPFGCTQLRITVFPQART